MGEVYDPEVTGESSRERVLVWVAIILVFVLQPLIRLDTYFLYTFLGYVFIPTPPN